MNILEVDPWTNTAKKHFKIELLLSSSSSSATALNIPQQNRPLNQRQLPTQQWYRSHHRYAPPQHLKTQVCLTKFTRNDGFLLAELKLNIHGWITRWIMRWSTLPDPFLLEFWCEVDLQDQSKSTSMPLVVTLYQVYQSHGKSINVSMMPRQHVTQLWKTNRSGRNNIESRWVSMPLWFLLAFGSKGF